MGFFDKIKKGLSRTKKNLIQNIESVIVGYPKLDDEFLDDMEAVLLSGDLGLATTEKVMGKIRQGMHEGKIKETGDVLPYMKDAVAEMLTADNEGSEEVMHHPEVILVVGVNGVGKTTTIGKLAAYYRNQGKKVLLAAADTFRAAASEQLTVWAERTGSDIVKHSEGADPAAVAYDAVSAAKARDVDVVLIDTAGRLQTKVNLMSELSKISRVVKKIIPDAYDAVSAAKARDVDVVLIDTAGRLQTKVNLMSELSKISRVVKKIIPDAPHQTLLVLDATTGQNAISQAKKFSEVAPVTGVVLTKLDGTAKGGVVLSVHEELHVPVKWVGVGEAVEDLQPFNAREFAEALFETEGDILEKDSEAGKEELHVPVKWVGVGEAVEDLQPFNAREFAEALFETEGDILEKDSEAGKD